ncbi:diguanylate cyclase [Desulfomarina sp.]
MDRILLVEDSPMYGRLVKARIEEQFDLPVFWTRTMKETVTLLDMAGDGFSMALLDFNLPDAPDGEVIDQVLDRGISSIVFTANMSDTVREHVWKKKVADYILKDDPSSLEYVIKAMVRLRRNSSKLVLIADQSSPLRTAISELLYVHRFRVVTASNGQDALEILARYPEICLVISGAEFEDMDGCTLCRKIRESHPADSLSIIGTWKGEDATAGARFLKNGANDFIKQDFLVEEFYSRINNCIENLNLIEKIKESAMKDFLTGLYNRRCFFDRGEKLYTHTVEDGEDLCCAMVDIDYFKKVNDSFGHDVGDKVIQRVAQVLLEGVGPDDIVARFGGEEFCLLLKGSDKDRGWCLLEELRKNIQEHAMATTEKGESVFVSISGGLCASHLGSLNEMIKTADDCLYRAKQNGRNIIVL